MYDNSDLSPAFNEQTKLNLLYMQVYVKLPIKSLMNVVWQVRAKLLCSKMIAKRLLKEDSIKYGHPLADVLKMH